MGLGEIRKSLVEFAQQQKEGRKLAHGELPKQREEIGRVPNGLGFRAASDFPLKDANGFDDSYFYGFCNDFENKASPTQLELAGG